MFKLALLGLFINLAACQFCSPGAEFSQALNKCFQFYRVLVDFDTAESICGASEGHLASIHNAIQNNYVSSQAQRYFNGYSWLGAKATAPDVTNPINWYWTDGSNFDYQNYRVGQPTSQGASSCMQVQVATTRWITGNCTDQAYFICEFDSQPSPTAAPVKIPSHCPSEYTWFEETDSCYKNFVKWSNYDEALATCRGDGADLASIHSQTENDFLVALSKAGITNKDKGWNDDVYIGLVWQENTWKWTDGTPTNFFTWGNGEPNNMNKEFWVSLVADPHEGRNDEGQRWNNIENIAERAFICKQPALH